MAILIKGMEMPKNCYECVFEAFALCLVQHKDVESLDRPSWCPLVEVPEPNRVMSKEAMEAAGFEI